MTKQKGQRQSTMETHEFIRDPEGTTSSPRPSPGSSSCNCNCKYPVMCSVLMALLVSLAVIAGLVIVLHPCSPQVPEFEDRCCDKFNVTRLEKVHEDEHQRLYKIYKIPKTGAYLIHGEVNMTTTDSRNSVKLFGKLREPHDIKHETIPYGTFNLVAKTELEENTIIYLEFNFGAPSVPTTTFTIYDMC